jgi:pentose-5-phosphate-3-epimerase
MSKIVDDGAMIKQKIDNALNRIKSLDMKRAIEFNLDIPFVNDRDVSFDDETVLLISLDDGNTEKALDSEKLKINDKITESFITIN